MLNEYVCTYKMNGEHWNEYAIPFLLNWISKLVFSYDRNEDNSIELYQKPDVNVQPAPAFQVAPTDSETIWMY